jgi:hypothetical protein
VVSAVSLLAGLAYPVFRGDQFSFAVLCSKQLPTISLRIQPNAQVFVSLDLVSTLAKVVELLCVLHRIYFQVGAKPIAAGFSQLVRCHWLTVFAENFEALHLTSIDCWLDSFGCFVRCNWIAVACDWGCCFGEVEEG